MAAPCSSREGPEPGLASPGPGGRRPIRALFLPRILAPLPWRQQPLAGPPPARFPLFLKIRHFQEEPERVGRESRQRGCPLWEGVAAALLPPQHRGSLGEQHWGLPPFTRRFSRFPKQPEKVFGLPSASPGTWL